MISSFGTHAAEAAFVGALVAAAFASIGTWWFGRRAIAYSHLRDTISELGASGTKDAKRVAWLWFFPNALAFAIGARALGESFGTDDARNAGTILAAVALGWIGAAIFPCDPGAPTFGTVRNHLHNVAGGVGYLAGAAGLFEMNRALEDSDPTLAISAKIGGGIVMLGLFLISFPELPLRGLIQRIAETALHGWVLVAAITRLLA